MRFPRWRRGPKRLGLRLRLVLGFGVGALLLSTVLASLTFFTTRTFLIRQRDSSSIHETFVNARLIRDSLRSTQTDIPRLLSSVDTSTAGSHPVLSKGGQWFSASVVAGHDALPPTLRDKVLSGQASAERFRLRGQPTLAIGVPLPAVDSYYFEIFSLTELQRTLATLRTSALAAAAITTIAGAVAGMWASRRLLHPVAEASAAAAEVAGGRLDVEMSQTGDRDLDALAASFNRMTVALRERIAREARFTSDVTHELRSPLTTLANAAEVLDGRRAELSPTAATAVELLTAEVGRFQRLVQDLLEISRIDAGGADPVFEDVTLGEFLLNAVRGLDGEIPVHIDAAVATQTARVDKRRLERVLANLVDNARAYGGGATSVSLVAGAGHVRLLVDDAGPGVAPEERQQIFERFSRGRSGRSRGSATGSGLGLTIVAEHVALHGGRVWVEDGPSGGARFVVELPERR